MNTKEEARKMCEENYKLVHYHVNRLARKVGLKSQDYDDLFSAGICGLLFACHRFDRSRNVELAYYSKMPILLQIHREWKRIKGLGFAGTVNRDYRSKNSIPKVDNTHPDAISNEWDFDLADDGLIPRFLELLEQSLSDSDRKICIASWLERKSVAEISRNTGFTRRTVTRAIERAKRVLSRCPEWNQFIDGIR